MGLDTFYSCIHMYDMYDFNLMFFIDFYKHHFIFTCDDIIYVKNIDKGIGTMVQGTNIDTILFLISFDNISFYHFN